MSKNRRKMTRAEFLKQREQKYRQAVEETGAATVYHIRHSCGHAVFWDDIDTASRAQNFPCIWCGAATGMPIPTEDIVCTQQGHVRRDPRIRCPKHETAESAIIAKHRADETCCQGAGSLN